jgi:hypothetical protein
MRNVGVEKGDGKVLDVIMRVLPFVVHHALFWRDQ